MRALKGLLIYIGIVLVAICSAAAVLLCVMYFVPSFRVFGVGCVHYNKKVEQNLIHFEDYVDYSSVELNINTNNVHVELSSSPEVKGLASTLELSVFGFATEITEYSVIKSAEVQDGVLNILINVTEPNGWFPSSDSRINIFVPEKYLYNVIVSTNKGNVKLGSNSSDFNLSNLSVTTGKGDLILNNLGEGEEEKSLTLDSLNLVTTKGAFDFTAIDNLTVNSLVRLHADSGTYRFSTLNAGIDVRGTDIAIHADEINCTSDGFKFLSQNGYFHIDTINSPVDAENTIITENCSVNISSITGRTGILTTYGDINVNTFNSYCLLESTTGNIHVNKALDTIKVTTDLGNITIDEYYKSGKFVTNKGDIKVSSKSEYSIGYTTDIISDDGNVEINNKANSLNLTTTGRAVVRVVFESIPSNIENATNDILNIIKIGEKSSAEIYFPSYISSAFRFKATGIISGFISGMEVVTSEQEQRYPSTASDDEISTSASYIFTGKIMFRQYSV